MQAMKRNEPSGYTFPNDMPDNPILLKKALADCGISHGMFAGIVGRITGATVGRVTILNILNKGYRPPKIENVEAVIIAAVEQTEELAAWFDVRGLPLNAAWEHLPETGGTHRPKRTRGNRPAAYEKYAAAPVDKDETIVEVEMLTNDAAKHFKLFRNPFIDDIRTVQDVFMSEEHHYILEVMKDAATHGGFVAVSGEVGSGKSVIRKRFIEEMHAIDNVIIIYPQTIDKGRLTASAICNAIVYDLSEERPKMKTESLTRQAQRLLLEKTRQGYHCVLVIEEAHDLTVQTLKYLKRFYELEDGFKKLLGIILVGQTELADRFDERIHNEMREVIRRCTLVRIEGLNGNLKDYLAFKFSRIKRDLTAFIDDDALDALSERLKRPDRRGRTVSHAYPLTVNNWIIRLMNEAVAMGEERVTRDVVMSA